MAPLSLLAAAAVPPAAAASDRVMSPTGVAVLIIIAFAIDFFAIGPAWMQTRLLFMIVATVAQQGFSDSTLDHRTVQQASDLIQAGLDAAGDAYVAAASAQVLVGCLVGCLSVWSIGCMLPMRLGQKVGRVATLQYKETGLRKLNWQIWIGAFALGLLADLPAGWMGDLTHFCLGLYTSIVSPLPSLVFGVS